MGGKDDGDGFVNDRAIKESRVANNQKLSHVKISN